MIRGWTIFLGLILVWLVPTVVFAQSGGLGIIPKQIEGEPVRSWFVYVLNPGEIQEDTVVISNNSAKSKTVVIEVLDGLTTKGGGYSLVSSKSDNQDIGTWVELSQSIMVMPPNSSKEVGFTLQVPQSASIGEHNGGIVVYERIESSGSSMDIKARVGARIYATVPGEITRQITFEKIDYKIEDGKLVFDIKAKNDSNIKLKPTIDIVLSGLFGRVKQEETDNGVYLAGSDMVMAKTWDRGAPEFGYYRVKFIFHTWTVEQVLADGTTSTLPDETFTYIISFWVGSLYVIWLLLVALGLWLIYRLFVYLYDRKKYYTRTEVHTVKKGETVYSIAEKIGIDTKVIIRFNRLPWPFTLNPGDQLLIPRGRLAPHEVREERLMEGIPGFTKYLLSIHRSHYHPRPPSSIKSKTTPKRKRRT